MKWLRALFKRKPKKVEPNAHVMISPGGMHLCWTDENGTLQKQKIAPKGVNQNEHETAHP